MWVHAESYSYAECRIPLTNVSGIFDITANRDEIKPENLSVLADEDIKMGQLQPKIFPYILNWYSKDQCSKAVSH